MHKTLATILWLLLASSCWPTVGFCVPQLVVQANVSVDRVTLSTAVSDDGKVGAFATSRELVIVDVPSGRELRRIDLSNSEDGRRGDESHAIAFLKDSYSLVGPCNTLSNICVYDARTGNVTAVHRTFEGIKDLARSPRNGALALVGDREDSVSILAADLQPIRSLSLAHDVNDPTKADAVRYTSATRVAWSPDGTILAVGYTKGIIAIYNVDALASKPLLVPGSRGDIQSLAISPKDGLLAIGSCDETSCEKSSISTWKTGSADAPYLLTPNQESFTGARFDSTGNNMLVFTRGGLHVIDLSTRSIVKTLNIWAGDALLADGRSVLSLGRDSTIGYWDLYSGVETNLLYPNSANLSQIGSSSKGDRLALYVQGNETQSYTVIDTRDTGVVTRLEAGVLAGGVDNPHQMFFDPADDHLITLMGNTKAARWNPETESKEEISLHNSELAETLLSDLQAGLTSNEWLAMVLDKQAFLAELSDLHLDKTRAQRDATIKQDTMKLRPQIDLINSKTGEETKLMNLPDIGTQLSELPNGKLMAVGTPNGKILLIDRKHRSVIAVLQQDSSAINSIALSPDERQLISTSADGTVRLWNTETRKLLYSVTGSPHESGQPQGFFAPDGTKIIVQGDGGFWQFEPTALSAPTRASIKINTGAITLKAISDDGSRLAAVTNSRFIEILDRITGASLARTEYPNAESFIFLGSGQLIFSAGQSIFLWEYSKGSPRRLLELDGIGQLRLLASGKSDLIVAANRDFIYFAKLDGSTSPRRIKLIEGLGAGAVYALSGNGQFVASGVRNMVTIFESSSGQITQTFPVVGPDDEYLIRALALNATGSELVVLKNTDAAAQLIDLEHPLEARPLSLRAFDFNRNPTIEAAISEDGRNLFVKTTVSLTPQEVKEGEKLGFAGDAGEQSEVQVVDLDTGLRIGSVQSPLLPPHLRIGGAVLSASGGSLAYLQPDGKIYVSSLGSLWNSAWIPSTTSRGGVFLGRSGRIAMLNAQHSNEVDIWDTSKKKELLKFYVFGDGTWVAIDAEGRFDTNNLEEIRYLHWVLPTDPMQPLPLEIFLKAYYEPRLLTRILRGERFPPVPSIESLNIVRPRVKIIKVAPSLASDLKVDVTLQLDEGVDHSGKRSGIADVKLFRDGRLVTTYPAAGGGVDLSKISDHTLTFNDVDLSQHLGEVTFSAYAFNSDGIKGESDSFRYSRDLTNAPSRTARAFILAIGVNAYQDERLNLEFAAPDAEMMARELSERLLAGGSFSDVVAVSLLSTRPDYPRGFFSLGTKSNILDALQILAGGKTFAGATQIQGVQRFDRATPDDLVVISFSGHGFMEKGEFYLIPSDSNFGKVDSLGALLPTADLIKNAISSKELSEALRPIESDNIVLIIDACQSAGVVGEDFRPGPMESRGLGQLAFDKGIMLLAATQSDNAALEDKRIAHGYLTYALTEEGLDLGLADFKPRDSKISMKEWLEFGAYRVPHLAYEIEHNTLKRATPVTRRGEPFARPQVPAFFDFGLRHRKVDLIISDHVLNSK